MIHKHKEVIDLILLDSILSNINITLGSISNLFNKYLIIIIITMILCAWIFYNEERPNEFMFDIIILTSIVIYHITTDYLSIIISLMGLIYLNYTLQPFFSPLIFEKESKDLYMKRQDKQFYIFKDEIYLIKTPLISLFKKIKFDIGSENIGIIKDFKYVIDPLIKILDIKGKFIICEINSDVWQVSKIIFPISYYYILEKSKEPEKDEVCLASEITTLHENGESGIFFNAYNRSTIPIDYYEGEGDSSVKEEEFWKKINKYIRFRYANGDYFEVSKGILSGRIKIGPKEEKYYYIYTNGKGYCLEKGNRFDIISSFKSL